MDVNIESSWKLELQEEFNKLYFKNLVQKVKDSYKHDVIFPPANKIFRAFDLCPFLNTKVVILGQDPYHGPNQANGLSFSVEQSQQIPPSLRNIYKELESDLNVNNKLNGDLTNWASQGVLLLNSIMTVESGKPGSHQLFGWEQFTDNVIQLISNKKKHVVFILWGAYAQKKQSLIDINKHLIIKSVHPSPLSASKGFFNSKPFSLTNSYLLKYGSGPINW